MWFKNLTGFQEESPDNVKNNIIVEDEYLISTVNNRKFKFGKLEIPTLEELRESNSQIAKYQNKIKISEIVKDVKDLHKNIANKNALFQVASQFNLLEMINPNFTPELGIDRYELDHTQGPICAVACGAGTIYRNYFVEINGQIGQSENNQIDCLDLIGNELENEKYNHWKMQNGYALMSENGLLKINKKISTLDEFQRENLKGKLKIGIQWNTEVTNSETNHEVSQIYCSALPVAYSQIEFYYWETFARIILEALYEATLYAGLINLENNNSNQVFFTLVGGGVFGNEENWILESMQKAINKFKKVPLDIKIVSYGKPNLNLKQYIEFN
ncbi:hypothetical protein EG240_15850 [Paenimyroides tangerinum]|uniref:Uncharacterized protein n=1 Tax=Paenimyroides tangerinum TaxID=2488728 RepID=A0A3P3VXX2_9FLAO|nr:hypothetical protein [Paenimyroides tangerinum]RRJ86878.1 hypothetical protein EG240_15850 [Paenimyroides tangerinum]